jgi:hypothetical protein
MTDATTTIGVGSSTTENKVTFGAKMQVPAGTASLQVEVQPAGTNFAGTPSVMTATSTVASGTMSYATVELDANKSYHWQARAINTSGTASVWHTCLLTHEARFAEEL